MHKSYVDFVITFKFNVEICLFYVKISFTFFTQLNETRNFILMTYAARVMLIFCIFFFLERVNLMQCIVHSSHLSKIYIMVY